MITKWSAILVLALAILAPSGCGKSGHNSDAGKPKDLVVGKWEDADGTSLSVEFSKDGSLTLTDKRNEPVNGKYAFTGENQVEVDDKDGKIPKMTFRVSVSANELTMTDFQSENRMVSFHDGKLLYSFPPGSEDGKRRNQIKFKRVN